MWKKKKNQQENEDIRLKQDELELCGPDQKTLGKFTTAHAALDEAERACAEAAIEKLKQEDIEDDK